MNHPSLIDRHWSSRQGSENENHEKIVEQFTFSWVETISRIRP
jgi:hypothetical protein